MDGVKVEEFLNQSRNVWFVRAIGGVLIVAAWVYFALPHFGSARFVADSLGLHRAWRLRRRRRVITRGATRSSSRRSFA